ncbi:unnamed protein product [Hymenolepis diminuta]|uniref:Uncharacterized protein n=1 Tax=Hymenolepis diminuta TaxID=6216 RepID=A0A564ZE28_HYMDI|nr:unnamed protein product [Hymenolepis diminuta]
MFELPPVFLQVPLKIPSNLRLYMSLVAGDDMKLHPSIRDSVKVTDLTHTVESSMTEFIPTRLVSGPSTPKMHESSTMIKSPKFLGQCNHIRAKPMLTYCPKRSTPVDDKCKQPEEISLDKLFSHSMGTVSKVDRPNSVKLHSLITYLLYTLKLTFLSPTLISVCWTSPLYSCLIRIQRALRLRQLFANQGIPKVIVSRYVTQFTSSRFEDICRDLNISLLHSPSNLNGQDEQLVDNMKRKLLVSQGEEIVKETLNSIQFRHRMASYVGAQI